MSEGIVNGIVIAVSSSIAAFLAWFTARRTARTSEITANAEVEDKASENWRELYLEVRTTMKEQQDAIVSLQEAVTELRDTTRLQKHTLEDQARLLQDQDKREHRFRIDLDAVFKWIESGMKPPAPTRPSYLSSDERITSG